MSVTVSRNEAYPIHVGDRLEESLIRALIRARDTYGSCRTHVISDPVVAEHYLPTVTSVATSMDFSPTTHVLPRGEAAKSAANLAGIWTEMHRSGVDRRTVVLGLGGGTICDVVTLAAATYMRGLPYVLVPTTLTAQADAAIGGKGGVDFMGVKNLVGAFYHPVAVVVDPELLRTLDNRQLRNGLAEIIKVAVISDAELFQRLESISPCGSGSAGELSPVVHKAIRRKLELLAADPFERNSLARPLNYGHCIGHAVEAASGFAIPHGEAVAAGMAVAASVGLATGHCSAANLHRILSLIARQGLPVTVPRPLQADSWLRMNEIRRIRNGPLHLVVPRGIGACSIIDDIGEDAYRTALARLERWRLARRAEGERC
jgi:3-dehydroquinate synthase